MPSESVSLWRAHASPILTDRWEDLDGKTDILIVGAGLTGLATAVILAEAGMRAVVIEAREVGSVTTGDTTGKVSLLQGSTFGRIADLAGTERLTGYVAANTRAKDWLRDFAARNGVGIQSRDAVSFSTSDAGRHVVNREGELAETVGLPVHPLSTIELPFSVTNAVVLPDQFQLDAMQLLAALVRVARRLGVRVIEGVRALGVDSGNRIVTTSEGELVAERIVLATGTPILRRGGHFATLEAQRSYAIASEWDGPPLRGMYLSVDDPSRSIRDSDTLGTRFLITGGFGHPVGSSTPSTHLHALREWTAGTFPTADERYFWSAQDYRSTDALPHVGPLVELDDRILFASGYGKWGMTNAVAAAQAIAERFGAAPAREDSIENIRIGISRAAGIVSTAGATLHVAGEAVRGVTRTLGGRPDEPTEGHGYIELDGRHPVAICRVGGVVLRRSAVCPHLGGIVAWNDAEGSWDCPLHGSRFSADGAVLEGPTVKPLAKPD